MFKHAFCGGKHETIAQARECQGGRPATPVFKEPVSPSPAKPKQEAAIRARRTDPLKPAKEGFYRTPGGEYYKVVLALHGSGRPYAKKLRVIQPAIKGADGAILEPALVDWEMASGAVFKLKEEWRLTAEQGGEFGALYGRCIKCGLPLTKEESIGRGMGDICAGVKGSKKQRATALRIWRQVA